MFEHVKTDHGGSARGRVLLGAAAMAAALGLGASTAHAELLGSTTSTTAQTFGALGVVDINGPLGPPTDLVFFCPATGPRRVMITYSAECAHSGTVAQWGTIQILLNGVVLSPTNAPAANSDDAFCSGNETVGVHDGWATQSMEVVGTCRSNAFNTVRVTAQTVGGGTVRLDDMSTVVDR